MNVGLALGSSDILLLLARGPPEPRGFGGTGKPLEVRNVAAAATEHDRTDPVDAIIASTWTGRRIFVLSI